MVQRSPSSHWGKLIQLEPEGKPGIEMEKQSSIVQASPSSQSASVTQPPDDEQVSLDTQVPKIFEEVLQKSTVQSLPSSQQAGLPAQKSGLKGRFWQAPWSHTSAVQGSPSSHLGTFTHAPPASHWSVVQGSLSLQHADGFVHGSVLYSDWQTPLLQTSSVQRLKSVHTLPSGTLL